MDMKRVLSLLRQAVDQYQLIEEGDKIAIGLSGGKDSMALLTAFATLKKFYPIPFELYGITVDLGFNNMDIDCIAQYCSSLSVPFIHVKTEIAKIVFEARNEDNPCSLCATMRKGALNNRLDELGINKVAYAHHKDDVVNTLFMSLIYEGRFHTISPKIHYDDKKITVIRPFIFMNEADIKGFVKRYNIPVVKSPCPMDKKTSREYVNKIVNEINKETPGVKNRVITAIKKGHIDGWIE